MDDLNIDKPKVAVSGGTQHTIPFENGLELTFLGILSLSFIGFFIFRGSWIGLVFGHTAALSIMVFYAALSGTIARWKGFNVRRAFQAGLIIPIIAGVISAFTLPPTTGGLIPMTCGGWIALGTGILIIIVYLIMRRKSPGR